MIEAWSISFGWERLDKNFLHFSIESWFLIFHTIGIHHHGVRSYIFIYRSVLITFFPLITNINFNPDCILILLFNYTLFQIRRVIQWGNRWSLNPIILPMSRSLCPCTEGLRQSAECLLFHLNIESITNPIAKNCWSSLRCNTRDLQIGAKQCSTSPTNIALRFWGSMALDLHETCKR